MQKYHIITFGCQMNKSDSERIATVLEKENYQPALNEKQADLVVINMCSVRQRAVDKVYHKILNLKSQISNLHFKTKILLTGCVLDKDKGKFGKLGVKFRNFNLDNIKPKIGYVPIMRGCNNFCTYCVVPYTCGLERYRDRKKIICEVKHLIKKGMKEITLLGQNVNSYCYKNIRTKKHKNKKTNQKSKIIDFADLLQEINALKGDFKIRFLTNHPKDMSDKLIDTIAKCKKVVKYIHLPMQSGDNEILKKMNRHYTREQYLALVKKIRNKIPDVELATDIIVGFPGETEEQFQNTADLVKRVGFATAYIAKYSPRPGTAAYKLIDDVPFEEKKKREQILRKLISPGRHSEMKPPTKVLWGAKPKNLGQRDPSARYRSPHDDNNKVVVILGPTASGKTGLSIKLAKKFDGEVVSADSRQVYKGMDIGTGKVTKKGRKGIPHYLLDVASPKRRFSVAQYQKKAIEAIQRILKKDKLPFLVGGSPFYIYAVVEGWNFPELKTDQKLRGKLEKKSAPELFEMLKQLDPTRAKTIEQKNKRRLIRAIEIAKQLGKVPELKKNPPFECLLIGSKLPKDALQQRIKKRVDKMIKLGLEKEVKEISKKYGFNSVLKESIGYQEWKDYFKGKIKKEDVIEKIKSNSHRFAKKQMTWFKKDKRIRWIKNYKEAKELVENFLNKQK